MRLLGWSVGLLAAFLFPASALAVDEFVVPTPDSRPAGITAGPGGLWFTEEHTNANKIARITTGGAFAEFGGLTPAPPPSSGQPPETGPAEITYYPLDGTLWFTEIGAAQVARFNPNTGAITECSLSSGSGPDGITVGPDNRIWFTQSGNNRIGRLDPTAANPCSTIATFPSVSTTLSGPGDIVAGPDGKLWFTEAGNRVSSITTGGGITVGSTLPTGTDPSGITASGAFLWFTEFGTGQIGRLEPTTGAITHHGPVAATGPSAITTGPDNALWFTETLANRIGRMTIGVTPTLTNEFAIPTPNSQPGGIAVGPDNGIWFTSFTANRIGRIATAPPFVPPPPPPPPGGGTAKTAKKCKVPKLKGLAVKKAIRKLKKAKCKYKIRGKGKVVSTTPKAGRTTTKRVTVKCKRKQARR